jgi:hypothetical protein
VALKKPSEYFKKDQASVGNSIQNLVKEPELNMFSDAFRNNLEKNEVLSEFSKTFENYRNNIEKANHLSEKVEEIQIEIQNLLKKEDLDRAMLSQLLIVDQSISDVQNKVKSINEKNLTEIRLDVSGLTESVNTFFEIEVPKYKKLVVDSEIRTNTRYEELEKNVSETLEGIGEFVDNKYSELTENLHGINEKSLASIIEDFKSLDRIVLELKEKEIPRYKGLIVETERKTESRLDEFQEKLDETVDSILEKVNLIEGEKTDLIGIAKKRILEIKNIRDYVVEDLKNGQEYKKQINKKVTDLEVEIVRNESHIRKQNQNLEQIQKDVRSAIKKLNIEALEEKNHDLTKKIKYLEEVFEKFNEKEILTENIIVEPSSTDNKDPLTPLDQNFVTLDQLQQHYKLFINRIQQQLATIGGGGETQLKYLDDIVGIATNASAYDGKFLKYNHSIQKFEFETVSGAGGGGGESYWVATGVGIHTTSNVGIAATNSISQLSIGPVYGIDTTVTGVTTTSATTIDTFSSSNFRSSRLQIQVTQGTNYQATDLLAIHDATSVSIIEYGSIATNEYLGSFNGIVVGDNVIISITMNTKDPAIVKVVSNKITL